MIHKKTNTCHRTGLASYLPGVLFSLIILTIVLPWQRAESACGTACTQSGSIWTCTNANYECIQDAVTAATAGDTINITASGTVEWPANALTIPAGKPLKLYGPNVYSGLSGTDTLTITLNHAGAAIVVHPYDGYNGTALLPATEIKGFYLNAPQDYDAGTSSIIATAIKIYGQGWRVHHNKIRGYTANPNSIKSIRLVEAWSNPITGSESYGLIDHNILYNGGVITTGGFSTAQLYGAWAYSDPQLGRNGLATVPYANMVYIEDNYFIGTYGLRTQVIDGNYGGNGYVLRHNTLHNAWFYSHGIQQDGYRGGIRSWEVYGNTIELDNASYMTGQKSGTGVGFNNLLSASYIRSFTSLMHERESVNSKWAVAGMCDGSSKFDTNTALYSGTHTGSYSDTVLTVADNPFTADALVGMTASNETGGGGAKDYGLIQGKYCTIAANTINTVTCASMPGGWATGDVYKISNGWPCRDQVGTGSDYTQWPTVNNYTTFPSSVQKTYPAYFWSNYHGSTLKGVDYASTATEKHVKNNRDFYVDDRTNCAAGGASCSAGVGCGTLTNRPASCTRGTAYWVPNASIDPTAASCSNLTGLTGPDNALAVSVSGNVGNLYRCTAENTWSAIEDGVTYTPYIYPHPLQGKSGASDKTPPAAPAGLTVN